MTTSELIKALAERLSLTQSDARRLLELQLERITDHLRHGRRVVLRNFGTLDVRVTSAHRGRLPGDGASVMIPDRRHVRFSSAKALKEEMGARDDD